MSQDLIDAYFEAEFGDLIENNTIISHSLGCHKYDSDDLINNINDRYEYFLLKNNTNILRVIKNTQNKSI